MALFPLHGESGEIDLEARKRSLPILEQHIAEREERLAEIRSDLKRLNGRLEQKVDGIVAKLSGIKDSQDSGRKVSQIKMRAMKGLARSVERYQAKRAELVQQLREGRSPIPREVLENDARIFDEHIAKRVGQILALSKSFTQDEVVEKYETVEVSSYNIHGSGWTDVTQQITEEWRQNRRDRVMDKKQHREVIEALKKSIERHDSLKRGLEESLASRKLPDSDRRLLEAELKRHERLLADRRAQLLEMAEVGQPDTEALTAEDARELMRALENAAEDLRRDFDQVFFQYAELNRERDKVAGLKANLEARKKWLEEYEAKSGGKSP